MAVEDPTIGLIQSKFVVLRARAECEGLMYKMLFFDLINFIMHDTVQCTVSCTYYLI